MTRFGSICAATVLLLGASAASYAQGPPDRRDARPSLRSRDRNRRTTDGKWTQHPTHPRPNPQQRQYWQQRQHNEWVQFRAYDFDRQRRNWRQRGGYQGYYLPRDHFRRHFGRSNLFRLYDLPFMIVSGRPRFQYDGYWVTFWDPYPEYWGDYWYETDDLYIDYLDDGYYLFNRRFPRRPGVAINIQFNL